MRWLQWSTYDLARGLGGVEVHARSMSRELARLNVENKISSDLRDLEDPFWDVVHTHGSSLPPFRWMMKPRGRRHWIHTLHGTTIGRMAACGEWTWPGGYAAAGREGFAVARADGILAVHERLWLLDLARQAGKSFEVCGNGWDSGEYDEELPAELVSRLPGQFWVYVGRGSDPVKGADLMRQAVKLMPDLSFVAVPGEGFEGATGVVQTGRLSPGQIRTLLGKSLGLLLPSRYEGMPLVVLEALAQGVPVVAFNVGGVKTLSTSLEGLVRADSVDPRSLADAVRGAKVAKDRSHAASVNRGILLTWNQVAERAVELAKRLRQRTTK